MPHRLRLASHTTGMKLKSRRTCAVALPFFFLLSGAERPALAEASQDASSRQTARGEASGIAANSLRAAATEPRISAFYKRNGWHQAWSESAERALRQSLKDRAKHGLDRLSFLSDERPADAAQRDVQITRAALDYASALTRGVTDPVKLHSIYTLRRLSTDVVGQLGSALVKDKVSVWLESLAPHDPTYASLSQAYLKFRQEESQGANGAAIAPGLLHVGDIDFRVGPIARQLVGGDYLSAQSTSGAVYTETIADAVKRLQRDYGIRADGVIGPDTLEILNLRPGDRARATAVALERLRWLREDAPATRIDVNTAAARLDYYRDGNLVDSRRVIVGRPGKETPQLLAPIYRLVANPTWTIPKSIQRGEMAHVSGAYLRSHNMVKRNGWIVQQPGPENALGLVKFDMRDRYAIYLHDTSSRGLFERSERHLSHGCVRVKDALGFAQIIAEHEGVADRWQKAQSSHKRTFVALPKSIPVRLLYRNVFVDHDGEIAFRTDPYGWNEPVARALGFANGSVTKSRAEEIDVGP